jgi:L-amino acid N-acyltransferase YncA
MQKQQNMIIRNAAEADIQQITEIYSYYVNNTTSTFEETSPDLNEMIMRWSDATTARMPFIVCCKEDEVVGYAYAFSYRKRQAYRYTAEESVYVKNGFQGKGAGKLLLSHLIKICAEKGYKQMVAVITNENNKDSNVNPSVIAHSKVGFKQAGVLEKVGYKFDCWHDTILMQRELA